MRLVTLVLLAQAWLTTQSPCLETRVVVNS